MYCCFCWGGLLLFFVVVFLFFWGVGVRVLVLVVNYLHL